MVYATDGWGYLSVCDPWTQKIWDRCAPRALPPSPQHLFPFHHHPSCLRWPGLAVPQACDARPSTTHLLTSGGQGWLYLASVMLDHPPPPPPYVRWPGLAVPRACDAGPVPEARLVAPCGPLRPQVASGLSRQRATRGGARTRMGAALPPGTSIAPPTVNSLGGPALGPAQSAQYH